MKKSNKPAKIVFPADGVRTNVEIENGVVVVGSDAHYWPNLVSTAHRAAVEVVRELKPAMYILNGDGFDGATASRHPRIQWEHRPTVKEELDAVRERQSEIEAVLKNGSALWTYGNHDIRFNSLLSANVPQFEGVPGFQLADHFPRWKFCTSVMINSHTMVKHRWHNGIHATWNNVLKSGTSIVTGHLHALQVRPLTDYRGTRYAVDTGTLAGINGPQFKYSEDSPANHRSGLAVLTFYQGKLMPPELVEVVDEDEGIVYFRGQVIKV